MFSHKKKQGDIFLRTFFPLKDFIFICSCYKTLVNYWGIFLMGINVIAQFTYNFKVVCPSLVPLFILLVVFITDTKASISKYVT